MFGCSYFLEEGRASKPFDLQSAFHLDSHQAHGLYAGSPEKKRADPAVLRSLCSHILPSGKLEVLVSEFSSWASVNQDQAMQFDWDDAIGNASRRAAGLKLEAYR